MKAALPSPSTVIGPRVTAFDTQSSSSSRESQTSGCSVTTRLGAAGPAITYELGISPQPTTVTVATKLASKSVLIDWSLAATKH
jgi:hypothetical protein